LQSQHPSRLSAAHRANSAPLNVGTSGCTCQPTGEGSMNDLAATFDAHVQAEFQDLDLEATMATMAADPYVHHVPTITGGNGAADVRDFYGHHFIGQWPDDTEIQPISRTVGQDQVVDELHITFTHDRELDIMLPGINPTGRRIADPVDVVVGVVDGKVHHDNINWSTPKARVF